LSAASPPPNQKKPEQFPRTSDLPKQSPKYWVKEKDRYIRQQLIGDIEALTGRSLVVYFAQLDQEIGHTDSDDLSEILSGSHSQEIDFFLHTPGGNVDATEKIISILKQRTKLSGRGSKLGKVRRYSSSLVSKGDSCWSQLRTWTHRPAMAHR
jgi:hypothetical protein